MPDIKSLKDEAKKFIREDGFENAVRVLQQIVNLFPEDLEGWYYLSISLVEINNFVEAEAAIKSALKLDSENADFRIHLGLVQIRQDRLEEGIESYKKALEFDSKSVYALIGLTECYLDNDDLTRAKANVDILENIKLTEEEEEDAADTLVRYFLEKAMENWTGSLIEDGETIYFPETLEQIEDAEHYIELAEITDSQNEYYLERIKLMKEVVITNRQVLEENNSSDPENEETKTEPPETQTIEVPELETEEKPNE